MSDMKDKFMSDMKGIKNTWNWFKPKIAPLIIGGMVAAAYVEIKYVPPSDVIASSPDRILPVASRKADGTLDMAEGALKPGLLEVKVCDAYPKKEGKEFVFVYNEKKQVGTVGPNGYIVITPFEDELYWCN